MDLLGDAGPPRSLPSCFSFFGGNEIFRRRAECLGKTGIRVIFEEQPGRVVHRALRWSQAWPEERAAMLETLGFKWFAYDYRAEHVPSFDAEMEALKRHHVRLLAWWFPGELNAEARLILDVLKRHSLRQVQLWVTGGGEPTRSAAEQQARVASEANRVRAIADEAGRIGCTVALYNHGAWFGEPENQIQIIERLRSQGVTNVGIVYNQHHGHAHVDRFPELLARMKPYLFALPIVESVSFRLRHSCR